MNAINPITVEATMAFTDLVVNPAGSGKDLSLDVSVSNKTTADALYSLRLSNEAGTVFSSRALDRAVSANDSEDIWLAVLVPPGFKLTHRASAVATIDAIVTGAQITRLP